MSIETQDFVILAVLSALVIGSSFFISRNYLTDKKSLKQRLISICISYIKLTIFYIVLKELTSFSVDYSILVLFFIALCIFTLWELMNLNLWEKGLLILVLITILGIRSYENAGPSTAYHLYQSELLHVENHGEILDLFHEEYRNEFTPEDFQKVKPYLNPVKEQRLLRFYQPALLEYEDGQVMMLEISRENSNNKLQFRHIKLLPEEVGSYFRHYPMEIERKAEYPQNIIEEEREAIIETKGSFISHASIYQEIKWYEKLIGVFGEKKVWDDMWLKLEGLLAPEGPVYGAGTSDNGYLFFIFNSDWKVDQVILNEIYAEFSEYATKNDINELPVVFKRVD